MRQKKWKNKVLAVALAIGLLGGTMSILPETVNASITPSGGGTISNPIKGGTVTEYSGLGMQYAMSKTVDLSGTGVDVTITEAEREAIYDSVKAEARDYVEQAAQNDLLSHIRNFMKSYNEVVNNGKSIVLDGQPYVRIAKGDWGVDVQENNSLTGFQYDNAIKAISTISGKNKFFDVVDELYAIYEGDACLFKENNPAYAEIVETLLEGKYDEQLIEYKTQELYNNEIGEVFVDKLNKQLNVKFSFAVQPLAKDGSEDAAFGVDGTNVKRGTFTKGQTEMPFSQVDFGARNQVYDEILNEDMAKIISGEEDVPEENRDGRDALTRALVFDLGQLVSSDDSQYAYSVNMERSRADGWNGWHFLLEVGDSLATYDVFLPSWSYVRTFNLHLNPAVTYTAGYSRADIITGAEFDDSGKLISITKPIVPGKKGLRKDYLKSVYDRLGQYFNESADGTYRFKLVESQMDPEVLPNGAKFENNTEEKIFDVIVKGGKITIELYENAAAYEEYQQALKDKQVAYDNWSNGSGTQDAYLNAALKANTLKLQALPAFLNSVAKEEEPTTEPTTTPDGDGTPDGMQDKEVGQNTPTDTPVDMDGGTDKDSGDSGKGGKGSKTGDSSNMIIPSLLALLALVTGGSVAIRRRRMDH